MDSTPADGVIATLRRIGATLVALLGNRIELVAVDVEEGVSSAFGILLWGLLAIWLASLALLALAATVVIACWDHRVLAAGLVSLAFVVAALAALLALRRRLKARPRFLGGTIDELAADAEALGGRSRDA